MRARHPSPPRLWLMTDERMGARLWVALERLPHGSGVVFRHYRLPLAERRALFARVAKVARRRGLVLLRAGEQRLGRWEDGTHGTRRRVRGWYSRAAHSPDEVVAGLRTGADLLFVSPVFATRSHPGATTLRPVRLGMLMRGVAVPVIALGGMDEGRARRLRGLGVYGWAGIDAWAG